jgi:hypothetical protein
MNNEVKEVRELKEVIADLLYVFASRFINQKSNKQQRL